MSVSLSLKNICRRFIKDNEEFLAVNNVNLDVQPGEFLTFLGPSGCGKTTTLRMIAGFETPSSGQILVDGVDITNVPANERGLGFVFQNYALFPHMTIFDNVAYGLKIRGESKDTMATKVREALALVGLTKAEQRYPSQLSGGEQQRVALARVLVLRPKLLLMDEPLSNLDAKLRLHMRTEIRRIQQKLGITCLYVTHDQKEALTMSDRIMVMHGGKIEQIGTPMQLYEDPATPFVADFIGQANLIEGRLEAVQADGYGIISVSGQKLRARMGKQNPRPWAKTPTSWCVRKTCTCRPDPRVLPCRSSTDCSKAIESTITCRFRTRTRPSPTACLFRSCPALGLLMSAPNSRQRLRPTPV